MTAIVKQTFQCGKCRQFYSAVTQPKECPNCKAEIKPMAVSQSDLATPITLSEQRDRLGKTDIDLYMHIINSHPDTGRNTLRDSMLRMEVILHTKKMTGIHLRDMCAFGKRIGQLSESIDAYVKAGGKYYTAPKTPGKESTYGTPTEGNARKVVKATTAAQHPYPQRHDSAVKPASSGTNPINSNGMDTKS